MNEKQSWLNGLNKKDRIASVLSILWIVIVILFVIRYNGDELGGSLEHFLWWGILPVFLYWGRRFWFKRWFYSQILGIF